MSEQVPSADAPKKKLKLPIIIGIALALVLGGGGFFAAYSGMLPLSSGHSPEQTELADVVFVPIPPLVVSLGPESSARHLKFSAQIEVEPGHQKMVAALMPRIQDTLNGYLRAVEPRDLEKPSALIKFRAHMLWRVKMIVGKENARDLLVTEFVLN